MAPASAIPQVASGPPPPRLARPPSILARRAGLTYGRKLAARLVSGPPPAAAAPRAATDGATTAVAAAAAFRRRPRGARAAAAAASASAAPAAALDEEEEEEDDDDDEPPIPSFEELGVDPVLIPGLHALLNAGGRPEGVTLAAAAAAAAAAAHAVATAAASSSSSSSSSSAAAALSSNMPPPLPSPIQESALPAVLRRRLPGVAVQSYTGSGKTLAYLLPALTLAISRARRAAERVRDTRLSRAERQAASEAACRVQAVVVAPSKELAMQIVRVARALLRPAGLERAAQQCIGGANPARQKEALLELRPLLVVGTPGRLAEFVRAGDLRLHGCPLLVLDEADQLLAANFERDLEHVMAHCGRRLAWREEQAGGAAGEEGAGGPASGAAAIAGGGNNRTADPVEQEDMFNPPRQTMLVSATLSLSVLSRFARWGPAPRGFALVTSAAVHKAAAAAPAAASSSSSPSSMPAPRIVSDAEIDLAMGVDAAQMGPSSSSAFASSSSGPEWGWGHRGTGGGEAAAPTVGAAGGAEAAAGLAPQMPPGLDHVYLVSAPRDKADAARRALATLGPEARALVFMNSGPRLKDAAFKLRARGVDAITLHGDLGKLARQRALERFARGEVRALVVSDVAARGLDLPRVDCVVNLELPSSAAHYAHRAGRAGRFGAAGVVVSVAEPRERFVVERLAARLAAGAAAGAAGAVMREAHASGGELRDGPDPRREQTAAQRKREKDGEARAAAAAAAAAAEDEEAGGAEAGPGQAKAGGAAKPAGKKKANAGSATAEANRLSGGGGGATDGSSSKRRGGAAATVAPLDDAFSFGYGGGARGGGGGSGGGKSGGAAPVFLRDASGMEVVVDADDDVPLTNAEEAESPEERRARLRAEVEAELAEVRAEKARLAGEGGGGGARAAAAAATAAAPLAAAATTTPAAGSAPAAAPAKAPRKKTAAKKGGGDVDGEAREPVPFDPAALAAAVMAQIDGKKPAAAAAPSRGGGGRGGGGGGRGGRGGGRGGGDSSGGGGGQRRVTASSPQKPAEAPRAPLKSSNSAWDW